MEKALPQCWHGNGFSPEANKVFSVQAKLTLWTNKKQRDFPEQANILSQKLQRITHSNASANHHQLDRKVICAVCWAENVQVPVCMRMCLRNVGFSTNALLQTVHTCSRGDVACIRIWCRFSVSVEKVNFFHWSRNATPINLLHSEFFWGNNFLLILQMASNKRLSCEVRSYLSVWRSCRKFRISTVSRRCAQRCDAWALRWWWNHDHILCSDGAVHPCVSCSGILGLKPVEETNPELRAINTQHKETKPKRQTLE